MCLLIVASRVEESAPLVVGANRDERLERPAISMTVLQQENPRILGGRDEVAGGTWLAVNEHGVVAALTNHPSAEGRDPTKRSRGELPLALAAHRSAAEAVERFVSRFRPADYNPAWLLVGDRGSLYSLNMTGGDAPEPAELHPGVHVLENLPFGEPSVKVDHVLDLLSRCRSPDGTGDLWVAKLTEVLADHSLPDRAAADAAEISQRPVHTLAACVHSEDYGTRSSTVVRVPLDVHGQISIWVADGAPCLAPFVDVSMSWEP